MKVEFYKHALEQEDIDQVVSVLRSTFLTTGTLTAEFERKFAAYTGQPYAVGLTSCTAALHLSFLALDIGIGDEVITPAMTFLASATSVMHAGATPVLVDVDPATGLIDPEKIRAAITPRTKAILPVHLYGTMADMKAISAIAKEHNLKVVEDCAHCVEGERDGVRPGDLSDVACYSFYATKNLTSGEGGAIASRHQAIADRIRLLRLHGMTSDAATRYTSDYKHWDMVAVGWKYNLDNIHAALLVKQIDRLDTYWKRRNTICEMYETELRKIPGVECPVVVGKSARHLQTVWVAAEKRDPLIKKLKDSGVGVAVNYRALQCLKYFREEFNLTDSSFPSAFKIGSRTLSLPLYPKMTDAEVEFVIATFKSAYI